MAYSKIQHAEQIAGRVRALRKLPDTPDNAKSIARLERELEALKRTK